MSIKTRIGLLSFFYEHGQAGVSGHQLGGLTPADDKGCATPPPGEHNTERRTSISASTKTKQETIAMTTYIALLRFTDQGARNIQQSSHRALGFRKTVEALGIKVLAQYWTAGQCDGVLILQGDSETKVLRVLADLAAAGNVRTESLRAFDAAEFAAIVGG